jgi:hypothetical protein
LSSVAGAARHVFIGCQLALEHLEQTAHFALIAIDGIWNFFRGVTEEHIGLTHGFSSVDWR